MTTPDLGPAELITLVFPSERAHPRVAQVLTELAAGRDIRVLDLVFIVRTSGDLIRITGAGEDLDDIGLGALQVSAPKLISQDDLGAVRDWLRPGTSAAVIAYEHSWARRLARAVRDAGGMVMLGRSSGRLAQERQVVAESQAAVREAEAESEAAVREAEAEAEAAERDAEAEAEAGERDAERYFTLGSYPAARDDLVSRLADLAKLHESGALSAAEFDAAKARLLAP